MVDGEPGSYLPVLALIDHRTQRMAINIAWGLADEVHFMLLRCRRHFSGQLERRDQGPVRDRLGRRHVRDLVDEEEPVSDLEVVAVVLQPAQVGASSCY